MTILNYIILILVLSLVHVTAGISGEIRGTVRDGENRPAADVSVTVDEPGITVLTDKDGKYTVKNISQGHYTILFSKTGYVSKSVYAEVKDETTVLDITIIKSLIETATIDVTSSFETQEISQSSFSISTLSLRNLTKRASHNLGLTINDIPGLNVITTGIGIGKPVIRGLSSNSVLVIRDGVKQEAQQWGDEHAPEISMYDIERIEILRGPASFLYGSEGIGGVVNIISKPLQFSGRSDIVHYGRVETGGYTVNNEYTGNISYGIGYRNFGFKGNLGIRKSFNVRTPEGILLVNTPDPFRKDTLYGGKLSNSGT